MTLNTTGTPYMLKYYSPVPHFTPFALFDFSIGYNGEFEIFEKKIVKNRKLKIQNIPVNFPVNLKFLKKKIVKNRKLKIQNIPVVDL